MGDLDWVPGFWVRMAKPWWLLVFGKWISRWASSLSLLPSFTLPPSLWNPLKLKGCKKNIESIPGMKSLYKVCWCVEPSLKCRSSYSREKEEDPNLRSFNFFLALLQISELVPSHSKSKPLLPVWSRAPHWFSKTQPVSLIIMKALITVSPSGHREFHGDMDSDFLESKYS